MSDFYYFDVGSRRGAPARWYELAEDVHVVGFEPDQEECTRLNERAASTPFLSEKHYPVALSSQDGARQFYVTRDQALSSFYRPIKSTFEGYKGDPDRADVMSVLLQPTRSLTSFCTEIGVWPTFLKLDTQGAEFDILSTLLRSDEILGIEIELLVLPFYEGAFTNFTQPQALLQAFNFEPWWYKPMYWVADHGGYNRIAWFDALYINSRAMNDPRMGLVLRAYEEEIGG